MTNQDLIRLHLAMMYRAIFRRFDGQTVDIRVAYDIAQAHHDFHRDLAEFVANLGEPDLAGWEDNPLLTDPDLQDELDMASVMQMHAELDDMDMDAMTAEFEEEFRDIGEDMMAATRDLSRQ